MSTIKKGDLVEFTDDYHRNYPPKDESLVRFGVALEDEQPGRVGPVVQVKLADGSITTARHIHAYAWAGWIPEGLEAIHEELNPFRGDDYTGEDYDY